MSNRQRPPRLNSQHGGFAFGARQPNGPMFNPPAQHRAQQPQQPYQLLPETQPQQQQQQQQHQQLQVIQQQQSQQNVIFAEQQLLKENLHVQQTVTKQAITEAAAGEFQVGKQHASAETLPAKVATGRGVPKGTLAEDYDRKVRPLIDLVDRLRRIGLDKDVGLPTIVVVGDQSAGKSSVLEAISGVQLPRGSGIVTRCPLELRLKRNSHVEWESRIKYADITENLFSHQEVGARVEQAQRDLAGETKGITDELITLEVESPFLPDLTLIDLPGITRVAVSGQKATVVEQIKAMIQRYIVKPESIILAVVPANVDIATSEALKLAENVDKPGDRTIGVITKMDLVDRGGEKQLLKILDNEQYHLKKGYVAVRCRSQQAIDENTSLQQALEEEDAFFHNSLHFKEHAENGQCGIQALSGRLAVELAEHIQRSMPGLKANIFQHLQDTRDKVAKMGGGLPKEKSSRMHFLNKMLQTYTDELKKLADGNEDSIQLKFRLHKMARDEYEKFAMTIQKAVPQKHGKDTNKVYAKFIDRIQQAMEEDRGRELPDFMKFGTFKRLVWGVVTQFRGPAMVCMEAVINEVQQRLEKLAEETFGKYPKLKSKINSIVASVVHDMKEAGDSAIEEMFSMEALVFSQGQTYTASLDHIRHDKGGELEAISHGFHDVTVHRRREAERMFTRIQAYLEICVLRVADVIPMIIMQHGIIRVIDRLRGKIQEVAYQPTIVDTLEENQDELRKRNSLQERLKRLEAAKVELDRVF